MSSAARFLLEFEATGDQEVVNKIRQVGAAGKETATDLQALQGIQDPFEPVASGAEAAIAPVENVGTAVTETAGTMTRTHNRRRGGRHRYDRVWGIYRRGSR